MKKIKRNIKKLYRTLDISPFGSGKIKLLIFLLWGLNAAAFINRDSILENRVSPEQLTVITREYFDNVITSDLSGSINVNLHPVLTGIIIDPGIKIPKTLDLVFNPNRAPPVIS